MSFRIKIPTSMIKSIELYRKRNSLIIKTWLAVLKARPS